MHEERIEMKIQKLPEEVKRQVLDFIEFLSNKYENREISPKNFIFDWEGGLSDIEEQYTSVEFQHKALEWR